MKIHVRDTLSLSFGFVLASPVLVMIASLIWAMLTPIDVESEVLKTSGTINHTLVMQGDDASIEFSEPLWMFSGNGWVVGFERKVTCFVAKNNSATCLRYGAPRLEADFVKMSRPYREAEHQRLILEEAAKSGQRI